MDARRKSDGLELLFGISADARIQKRIKQGFSQVCHFGKKEYSSDWMECCMITLYGMQWDGSMVSKYGRRLLL